LSNNVDIEKKVKAKTRTKKIAKTNADVKVINDSITPVTRNCNSCALNDDVIGCRLTGGLSPLTCIRNVFAYYKKGKQFFFCERCETHSVTSQIAGFISEPHDPRIVFWCQKCDNYPIVEGEEYHGYSIEGIKFTKRRNTFLYRKDDKGDIFK
jgi:hypothetical protein